VVCVWFVVCVVCVCAWCVCVFECGVCGVYIYIYKVKSLNSP